MKELFRTPTPVYLPPQASLLSLRLDLAVFLQTVTELLRFFLSPSIKLQLPFSSSFPNSEFYICSSVNLVEEANTGSPAELGSLAAALFPASSRAPSARSSHGRAPAACRCLPRVLRLPGARRPVAQPSRAPSSSQRCPAQFGRSGADICCPNLIARPAASPYAWTFGLQLSALVLAPYSNARPWCWPRAPRSARPRPHRRSPAHGCCRSVCLAIRVRRPSQHLQSIAPCSGHRLVDRHVPCSPCRPTPPRLSPSVVLCASVSGRRTSMPSAPCSPPWSCLSGHYSLANYHCELTRPLPHYRPRLRSCPWCTCRRLSPPMRLCSPLVELNPKCSPKLCGQVPFPGRHQWKPCHRSRMILVVFFDHIITSQHLDTLSTLDHVFARYHAIFSIMVP
jgi:hypothetical protein